MENKRSFLVKEILALLGIVLVIALVVAWLTTPIFRGDRFDTYIRMFLFLFAILVMAVLRLYNAVVANTRYNIALIKILTALHKMLPGVHSTMQKQILSMNSYSARIKSLNETIESAREVLDEINRKNKK